MANIGTSIQVHEVINGDDFICHTGAAKDRVKHIGPPQRFFCFLLYGLHQRTHEDIKSDGQKYCV